MVWIWATIGLLALVYILQVWWKNKKKMLPPGPRGFPIFGSLHLLGKFPDKDLHRLAQKYGDIMYMRLGLMHTIVVSSPQAAELFLKTHDLLFASRPPHEGAKLISFGQRSLVFSEYGAYWRDTRKMCTLELLSNHKINSFKSMRRDAIALCVESIRATADNGRVAVDLSDNVSSLSVVMSCRMVLGKMYRMRSLMRGVSAPFDLQGFTKRMKSVNKAFDTFFEKVIDEHIQSNEGERTKDFVDVMVAFMGSEQSEYRIERPHIKAIIFDMLVNSIDTSSVTVEWALSELMRHPKAMKKVQKELEDVVGLGRMVEESDLGKLDYLSMVVKETMRLHPVAPLLVPHAATEDCIVNGYHIPKKSRVIINAWAIGRDPSAWTDAEEFIPERFEGSDVDVRGNHFQLIPFGSGRRRCPGIQLGLMVVQLMLAQLVHCFDWELPNNMLPEELDMTEVFGITVARAKRLIAIPSYRLHK
ncbi:cytochrome P450 CYP736A12 [Prunus yedoensis var. nudiflora]|uniref:Cytochrome P450 CYP736A12 n=1 Tax=Prunus yedoensis var. nudiflora TaxID=2094558 RepID=A0A314UV09_PRUYE|nr:cytochrome P450 CYP736A12 [Prunus yedoensis var. nudiflora]